MKLGCRVEEIEPWILPTYQRATRRPMLSWPTKAVRRRSRQEIEARRAWTRRKR